MARRDGGEKQIRMNEAKITVMARFTITVIETEICESPTLTAETSLERLPTPSFKPNPSYLPTNASTFGIIRYLNFTTSFTLAPVLSCFTIRRFIFVQPLMASISIANRLCGSKDLKSKVIEIFAIIKGNSGGRAGRTLSFLFMAN